MIKTNKDKLRGMIIFHRHFLLCCAFVYRSFLNRLSCVTAWFSWINDVADKYSQPAWCTSLIMGNLTLNEQRERINKTGGAYCRLITYHCATRCLVFLHAIVHNCCTLYSISLKFSDGFLLNNDCSLNLIEMKNEFE